MQNLDEFRKMDSSRSVLAKTASKCMESMESSGDSASS